jgi:hypothetical protein
MARFLVLIGSRFEPLFCLVRSVRLAFLPIFALTNIKGPCLLEIFFDAKI